MPDNSNAFDTIEAATRAATPAKVDAGEMFTLVVPEGATVEKIDTEHLLDKPRRKHGTITLRTGESLGRYVTEHKSAGSAIFADVERRSIVAVLNDHAADAGWGDHRASLTLQHTPEWNRWAEKDRQMMNQTAFAELIEDGFLDITEPEAADMLELASTFEAAQQVEFRSGVRLDSGQRQLTWVETVQAKAGVQGQVVIPAEFVLGLPPFDGCDPYRLVARLRYRIREGALSIGYVLDRPEDVIRSAFADVVKAVDGATGITPYAGRPRAAS